MKGAKLDPKIGLYFTHRNGPVFRAKTDLSDLECEVSISPAHHQNDSRHDSCTSATMNFHRPNLPMELTEIMCMTIKSLSASAVQEIKVARGTQQEYSSKPLKHSIVKRILVFKR